MELTDEEENFVKLANIILNIVPRHLRNLFIQKWNVKFSTSLWNSDPASSVDLLNKIPNAARRRSACFADFEKKILTGKELEWDPTLLVFLFLYSEIELIDKCRSKTMRYPPLLISEEIDKIRCIRNGFFAHVPSMSCSTTDFMQLTTELKGAARHAFGQTSENEIDAILASGIKTQLSEQLKQQLDKENELNREFQIWTEKFDNKLEELISRVNVLEGHGVIKPCTEKDIAFEGVG